MFNTHVEHHETRVTPVTRVIEQSISPDKVTEMYDKVREEVTRDLLKKLLVSDDILSGIVIELQWRDSTRQHAIWTSFSLNGKVHVKASTFISDTEASVLDDHAMVLQLHEHYREVVSQELIKHALNRRILPL